MRAIAHGMGRVVHKLLVFAGALIVLAALAGLALAWRLSQGPIDLAWAARRIEASVNRPDQPSRLVIGDASVEWEGFAAGPRRGLEFQLHNVRVVDRATGRVASAGHIEMTVVLHRLLLGQIVPLAVLASGLELHLVRNADHSLALDFGGMDLGTDDKGDTGTASLADSLAELARPPRQADNPAPPALQHIEQLRRVRLGNSLLVLEDRELGTNVRLVVRSLDLERPPGGGVHGSASAALGWGAARATLALQAQLAPDGGTELQLQLAPVATAAVQREATETGAMNASGQDALDAAVQATASLALTPDLLPTHATLHVESGGGTMRIAGSGIGFDSLVADASADWTRPGWSRPSSVTLGHARAVLNAAGGAWPTAIDASGTIGETESGRIGGQVQGTVDHLAFADIASLWPERLGGHTRPWIIQNLTGGTARDGTMKVTFEAAPDLTGLVVKTIDGSLTGDDVTIWWFRPAPPVEHAQALLTIHSPELLDVAITSAKQGPIPLSNGTVRITGLNVKDQFLALSADATGQAADVIALLKHPRLGLLDKKPIPMRNPSGSFTGHLAINLPLNEDLRFEQVTIATQAHFSAVHLGGLVGGRDLDRGDVQLDATQEMLHVAGTAAISGLPSDVTIDMDFRPGPATQVVQRATASTTSTAKQLAAAGLDPGSVMPSGTGQFTATYRQRRDTTADLQIKADLQKAALAIAGWHKPPGPAADAQARLLLRADKLVGIDQLSAHGPGMVVEGRAELVGDRPLVLQLERIVLGPTQARGEIRFPAGANEPIRASLTGSVLDLSTQLSGKTAPAPAPSPGPSEKGTPWVADIHFDRVLLAEERSIGGVTAHAENDGRRVSVLRLGTTGPERIEATIQPEGTGRRVRAHAADGGAVLRALGALETMQGGRLMLDAHYDDRRADPPLTGTLEIADFHVRNVPILGKLLQAATIYGVLDALSGPGLLFTQLTLPFQWDGSVLVVEEARAFSASLGLTAHGRVDQARQTIDLRGTIVPAYVFNSALGRIPLVGRLFSRETGGGLFAVDYGVRGPVANPQISANPLSALTPGILRGLFHIGE